MAADTRDPPPSSPPPSPVAHPSPSPTTTTYPPYQGKIYESFHVPPSSTAPSSPSSSPTSAAPENANLLPGGATNTAGGRPRESTLLEAAKTVRLEELKEVHKRPCVRDALLMGIGGGFGVGGVRGILGASLWKASNWAAWTFVFGSWASYEYCQRKRELEMKGMKRAVEIVERKKIEKEQRAEETRAARRKAKEEADRRKEEDEKRRAEEYKRRTGSWRFWG